jgi:hypothetical protein
MKNILCIMVCFLLMLMLVGCSTILEPTKPEDSLLIGQLTLKSEGWEDFMNASINGTLKGAISMQIENTDTGETYATSTSSNGFFSKINPASGIYVIKKLVYQNTSTNAYITLTWEPNIKLKYIQVDPGKVINIGILTWVATKNKDNKKSSLIQDDKPEILKDQFVVDFPKSLWLQREWVNLNPFTN